jgi:hypothetical protein
MIFKDEDLNFPFKEGEIYYIVDSFMKKPLVVEGVCHKLDPEEYDWEYGILEKKKIYGDDYPVGRYTHPEDIAASEAFSSEERKEILNNYFFNDYTKAQKRAIKLSFEGNL